MLLSEVDPMAAKRLIMVLGLLMFWLTGQVAAVADGVVYVLPVKNTIDGGLARFLERAYREADAVGAKRVILEIDTPGGLIKAATDIRDTINNATTPTTAFVHGGAISAGALIALISHDLVMTPGSTIGAAEPRFGTQKADEKIVSYWSRQLSAAAEARGRDPVVAAAMADADLEIPGLVAAGKLLTLTSQQALEHNIADQQLQTREQVLAYHGLQDARLVELTPSTAETVARWVTNPYVSPILLTIGFAGLLMELFTVGFGVPGTIGVMALAVYFAGHMVAGLTGWEALLLFLLGLLLLVVEAFVLPGFGLAGFGGVLAMVISIVLAAPSTEQAVISLVIALLGTIVLVAISIKLLPTRRVWRRLVLNAKQQKDQGYTAPVPSLAAYLGETGVTITPLRPAGAVEMANGERLDVVTDGSYVLPGIQVRVVKVEGTRVVVRPVPPPSSR